MGLSRYKIGISYALKIHGMPGGFYFLYKLLKHPVGIKRNILFYLLIFHNSPHCQSLLDFEHFIFISRFLLLTCSFSGIL